MTMPIADHYLIEYLCKQFDDDELKDVLKNTLNKPWVK
jgi:hypothetical protein